MQRSLPLGDYSVPLLIGDKQGLSQKQTVHVRVCSCPDGLTCAEPLVARAGVLQGALAPLGVAFMALAGQHRQELSWECSSSPRAVSRGHRVLGSGDGRGQRVVFENDSQAHGRPRLGWEVSTLVRQAACLAEGPSALYSTLQQWNLEMDIV